MKHLKKLTMLLMALTMSTSLMAQTSTQPSNYETSTGLSGNPYFISSLNNLYWLSQTSGDWNKYYEQTTNIDAVTTSGWDGNAGFSPIGNATINFTGSYDGQNNTIENLYINRAGTEYVGLFGVANGATISNIGIENAQISGKHYTGVLAGHTGQSTISNCYSSGNVNGFSHVGGLIGLNRYGSIVIYSYSAADVSADDYIGGFIGQNRADGVLPSVYDCYSKGDIVYPDTEDWRIGNFIGENYDGNVYRCYATGQIINSNGDNPTYRGFIGKVLGTGTKENNFWDKETSCQSTAHVNAGATGKTTAEMQNISTFTEWTFSNNPWSISPLYNTGYPNLDNESGTSITWTGTTDTEWAVTTNWNSDGVLPNCHYDVTIPSDGNQPIIAPTGTGYCKNLTVNNGASLTIQSTAAGTGSLIVEGTPAGNVTVERFLTHDRWHYISGQTNITGFFSTLSMGLSGGAGNDQFYRWYEDYSYPKAIGNWVDILNGEDGTGSNTLMDDEGFVAGKGYAINYIDDDEILSLSGVPYTTSQDITITKTPNSTGEGSNLIGNPFCSTIAINTHAQTTDNFLSQNTVALDDNYEAIYLWNESVNWNGSSNADYVAKNNTDEGETFVAPGQAFMVMAATDDVTINFNTSTRKHGSATFYKNGNNDDISRFELFVINSENQGNSTLIAFLPEMTLGLDPSFDAGKLKGNPDIALYTRLIEDNGVDFAIQALPISGIEEFKIPVGIDILETTILEFSAKQEKLDNYNIMLEDRQENTFTNLRWDTYFAEISESGTGRFYLHFKDATAIGEVLPQSKISCFAYNGKLIINNPENQKGVVSVTNLTGRQLFTDNLSGSENQEINLALTTGIYIVYFQTEISKTSKKIYIK